MRRTASLLPVIALLLAGCGERFERIPQEGLRMVALAPNAAEILFALGLGDQVVGVSSYTVYPPEAAGKPSVGGTYDPDWERIVSLQPGLVIGLDSQKEIAAQLRLLGIPFLGVAHERVEEILESIRSIGSACGAEPEAQELFDSLKRRMEALSSAVTAEPKPRVLVCVGHDETLSRMYVAGKNTFYEDLIALAGGVNACESTGQKYPEISREGLIVMRPDRVIVIAPGQTADPSPLWHPFPAVVFTNDYASIPGPRFVLLLEDLVAAIHQERGRNH